MTEFSQVPIQEGLFTWPSDQPQLIGSRCDDCANTVFPVASGCIRCSGDNMQEVLLPRQGHLWSWTIQGFLPKSPYAGGETEETFKPYGVGYVDLGPEGNVRVESRLHATSPDELKIGMPMTLVIEPLRTESDDTQVMCFAFAPVAEKAAA